MCIELERYFYKFMKCIKYEKKQCMEGHVINCLKKFRNINIREKPV